MPEVWNKKDVLARYRKLRIEPVDRSLYERKSTSAKKSGKKNRFPQ